jgi:tetratricopeptide (TPR) repeat protein
MLEELLSQLQEKQAQLGSSGTAAAFELNWESLDADAQTLACLLSLFALAPIPWSLVAVAAGVSHLEFDLEKKRSTLVQHYLLQCLDEDTYQLHEVIRDLLHAKLEELTTVEELKRGFCQALVAIAQDIPETPTLQQILKVAPAIPHLAEVATLQKDWLSDDDVIWPFVGLSGFYEDQGAYEQALPWRKQCLSTTRERLGEEHPSVATSLNNLAYLYYSQGRYAEAEPLLQQALELRKRLLGTEHPDVASSLSDANLGGTRIDTQTKLEKLPIKEKIDEEEKNSNVNQRTLDVNSLNFDSFTRTSWDVVSVAPVRTIVRREEEITLIRRVRKTEETEAHPSCPMNTSQLEQVPKKNKVYL